MSLAIFELLDLCTQLGIRLELDSEDTLKITHVVGADIPPHQLATLRANEPTIRDLLYCDRRMEVLAAWIEEELDSERRELLEELYDRYSRCLCSILGSEAELPFVAELPDDPDCDWDERGR